MGARRTASGAVLWPNQHPCEEWAAQLQLDTILQKTSMIVAVHARTGDRCYVPECPEQIRAYPHAFVESDGGVHHPVNRLGVCLAHLDEIRRPPDGFAVRRRLQQLLMGWYMAAGVRGSAWGRMALGRAPIPPDLPAVGPATWEVAPGEQSD